METIVELTIMTIETGSVLIKTAALLVGGSWGLMEARSGERLAGRAAERAVPAGPCRKDERN